MTTATVPEGELSGRGRHLPEAGLASRMARVRAEVFAQTALAACLIVLIWPASLGGAFGVVAVAGHSMEPTFELGDVVITGSSQSKLATSSSIGFHEGAPVRATR